MYYQLIDVFTFMKQDNDFPEIWTSETADCHA